jgi:hypothetical protein
VQIATLDQPHIHVETAPDPNTPGAISPKVTQDTLATTICRTGYTKSIRPPASITEIEKRENAAAYGYTGSLKDVEYDHLVPLEVGGDPNDPRNLRIEPGASPNQKDGVESRLHELVCEGRVPLAAAQQAIATDWTTTIDNVRWSSVIAASQGYETKASADKGIESVKTSVPNAKVMDLTEREPGHN